MLNTGIYQIKNLKTGKIYIGSTNDFSGRETQHFSKLEKRQHVNQKLQSDYNVYGKNNFKFSIVEYTLDSERYKREQFWINYYKKNSYNVATAHRNNKTTKNEFRKLIKAIWRKINEWIF